MSSQPRIFDPSGLSHPTAALIFFINMLLVYIMIELFYNDRIPFRYLITFKDFVMIRDEQRQCSGIPLEFFFFKIKCIQIRTVKKWPVALGPG